MDLVDFYFVKIFGHMLMRNSFNLFLSFFFGWLLKLQQCKGIVELYLLFIYIDFNVADK